MVEGFWPTLNTLRFRVVTRAMGWPRAVGAAPEGAMGSINVRSDGRKPRRQGRRPRAWSYGLIYHKSGSNIEIELEERSATPGLPEWDHRTHRS